MKNKFAPKSKAELEDRILRLQTEYRRYVMDFHADGNSHRHLKLAKRNFRNIPLTSMDIFIIGFPYKVDFTEGNIPSDTFHDFIMVVPEYKTLGEIYRVSPEEFIRLYLKNIEEKEGFFDLLTEELSGKKVLRDEMSFDLPGVKSAPSISKDERFRKQAFYIAKTIDNWFAYYGMRWSRRSNPKGPYREESFKHMGTPAKLREGHESHGDYIARTSSFLGRPMSDQEIEESKKKVKEEQRRQEIKLKARGKLHKMRSGNPASADDLIKKCRALYMTYYNKPNKSNLRKLSDFLDVMKENKSKKAKQERKKAMSFVRRESSYFNKGKKNKKMQSYDFSKIARKIKNPSEDFHISSGVRFFNVGQEHFKKYIKSNDLEDLLKAHRFLSAADVTLLNVPKGQEVRRQSKSMLDKVSKEINKKCKSRGRR